MGSTARESSVAQASLSAQCILSVGRASLVFLTVGLTLCSRAEEAHRADSYGDPLPTGAITRMGNARFKPRGTVACIVFSPDGKTLASSGRDVCLWDVASGRKLFSTSHLLNFASTVAFWPEPKTFVYSGDYHGIHIRDAIEGKEVAGSRLTGNFIYSFAASPDGKHLALAASDGIRIWDRDTSKVVREMLREGCAECVCYSPDGSRLASGCHFSDEVYLWDVATGEVVWRVQGHENVVRSVAFSEDGRMLASASDDHTVRLWEVATGKEVRALRGHTNRVHSVAFSPDGKTVASGGEDCAVRLWDVTSGKQVWSVQRHRDNVRSVAFSPDGKTVASGSSDMTVRFWDAGSGAEIPRIGGHALPAQALSYSPDGRLLASASGDKTVRLWVVATGQELLQLRGHQGAVHSVAFSPDGKTMASGSKDKSIRVWDVRTGNELRKITDSNDAFRAVCFSPEGKTLASASYATVQLWDPATGRELSKINGEGPIVTVAFSADGKRVLAGSARDAEIGLEKAVSLWDVATGKKLAVQPDHVEDLTSLVFPGDCDHGYHPYLDVTLCSALSPDGRLRAFARPDAQYRWWMDQLAASENQMQSPPTNRDVSISVVETLTGDSVREFPVSECMVGCLSFSPDGKTLASGMDNTTVLIWDLAPKGGTEQKAESITAKEMQRLWDQLAAEDGAAAYAAIWDLVTAREKATVFLREKLPPLSSTHPPLPADLAKSQDPLASEAAQETVDSFGLFAEAMLKVELARTETPEARAKLERALEIIQAPCPPESRQVLRAIAVLERIGSTDAKRALGSLARSRPQSRATLAARAALSRLGARRLSPGQD